MRHVHFHFPMRLARRRKVQDKNLTPEQERRVAQIRAEYERLEQRAERLDKPSAFEERNRGQAKLRAEFKSITGKEIGWLWSKPGGGTEWDARDTETDPGSPAAQKQKRREALQSKLRQLRGSDPAAQNQRRALEKELKSLDSASRDAELLAPGDVVINQLGQKSPIEEVRQSGGAKQYKVRGVWFHSEEFGSSTEKSKRFRRYLGRDAGPFLAPESLMYKGSRWYISSSRGGKGPWSYMNSENKLVRLTQEQIGKAMVAELGGGVPIGRDAY